MSVPLNFILIDDSSFDLFIYEKLLIKSGLTTSVSKYNSARDAFAWLTDTGSEIPDSIILLDLQMPDMNGFEFIDAYDTLPSEVKNKIKIYMLSSTIDTRDIEKAKESPYIIDLLSKPLEVDLLREKLSL
ncbi:hypothetical protein DYBT9275_01418 [Dyadobacter sp. CECT 9275]|uniref:Response regulatory domain-containing protein n=1 Tax=Dyadobacter helix TaxID=2822344 RepID=A0A916JAI1_9BACT|nr:response regulator [Dyadobacter sp. CECT 9275]CAG4994557.1 hypothetical protein DYBT9275_01418 [Dyadobacter sp. CECT 9275]